MASTATALVTGGTSGIGRAAANKLAQLGIHVLVVGRDAERGKKTVDEIRATGGKADFISSDLRGAASAREVVGIDIAAEVVAHARSRYLAPNLRYEEGSCTALPLADGSIDLIVSFETLR